MRRLVQTWREQTARADKGNWVRFDVGEAGLAGLAERVVTHAKQVEDAVARSEPGWDTTILPLLELERDMQSIVSSCDFMQHVSDDVATREASAKADEQIAAYMVDSGMRHDVYAKVKQYWASVPKLEGEHRRFVEHTIRDYERNGLHLDVEKQAKVKQVQQEMSRLQIEFSANLAKDESKVLLTKDRLPGMSDDYFEGRECKDDEYIITMAYPDVIPVLKLCSNEETRRQVYTAFARRCIVENTPILERLVELRHQQSQLLGYKNHADYILQVRMAKTPDTALSFLRELRSKLQPLAAKELEILREIKGADVYQWDLQYLLNKRMERDYKVDHQEVRSYFPLPVVTKGLLDMYQQLLGLTFEQIDAPVWHKDVDVYAVRNPDDALVGYFYLDLFPRTGKYGHAACFGLQAGCQGQLPVAAMVANFTKPTSTKPSLLQHSEVVTYFHEFGHVMHQICSETELSRFAGTRVERDFVEAPSQMLENWCWEPESLRRMSAHYKTGEPIPKDVLRNLVAAKNANAGLLTLRQIFFGLFDLEIHAQPRVDAQTAYNTLLADVMCIPAVSNTNGSASFGHLAGGYDASYYGYLWSQVFSADMFATIFQGDKLMDPARGQRYRSEILRVGGSRDATTSIKAFLGRDPTQEAFLRQLGVNQ